MDSSKNAMRKRFGKGHRVLFSSQPAYHNFGTLLLDQDVVDIFSGGFNKFSDKTDWPYYIYITRKSNDSPLDEADEEYLDELIQQLNDQDDIVPGKPTDSPVQKRPKTGAASTRKARTQSTSDLSTKKKASIERYVGVCPYCREERLLTRNGPDKYPWACEECAKPKVEALEEAVEIGSPQRDAEILPEAEAPSFTADIEAIGGRLKRLDHSLEDIRETTGRTLADLEESLRDIGRSLSSLSDEIPTRVSANLSSEIRGLLMEGLKKAIEKDGEQTSIDQLHGELSKREADLLTREKFLEERLDKAKKLEEENRRLQKDNGQLRSDIADLEHRGEEEKVGQHDESDTTNGKAAPKNHWKYSVELFQELHTVDCGGLFWKHLQDRCSPKGISVHRLLEAVIQLKNGTNETKPVSGTDFFEYRCNLGQGHGPGRLYFDKQADRYILLGFGNDHDQQKHDIKKINKRRKDNG